VHGGDSVPEDQLHAFLTWYSAVRPEVRAVERMRSDLRLAAMTHRDDDVTDNNDCQPRHNKLPNNNELASPPASEHSDDTPVAVTPNRCCSAAEFKKRRLKFEKVRRTVQQNKGGKFPNSHLV